MSDASVARMGDDLLTPEFADGLRLLLRRAALTHEELAERTGLSPGSMTWYARPRMEGGRIPEASVLRKMSNALAAALDVPTERVWDEFGKLLDNTPERTDSRKQAAALRARANAERKRHGR